MRAVLISLGPRDLLTVDGAARVAEAAGVGAQEVVRVERLAERALRGPDPELAALFGSPEPCVAGCSRPRAARALLALAGAAPAVDALTWLALPFDREALKLEYGVPWYPVIDRSRCTGCGTCHDYCLFGVYAQAAGAPARARVQVAAPLSCKVGCPACARLCPEAALLFPFCHDAELNGEVDAPARRTPDALAAALGDDPLRVLAERRRQKRLVDPAKFEQAEKDRVTHSGVL